MNAPIEPLPQAPEIGDTVRSNLAVIGDALLPEAHGMPSASQVDVGGRQLDLVLRSRPDLVAALERAVGADEVDDPMGTFEELERSDPEGHEAVTLSIVAAYYLHPRVCELIGYPGQQPLDAQRIGEHEVEEEGLLDLLDASVQRGPVFRPTPDSGS
jgi:hypothetical protein